MDIITKDNLLDITSGKYIIGVNNEDKYPNMVGKVKGILIDMEKIYPQYNFYYLNNKDNPKTIDKLFKGGIEYFPLFGIIKDQELDLVYFGKGGEEFNYVIKEYNENNN